MKTAVITGGAKGIGYAVAQKLCEEGYRTVIFARSPQNEAESALKSLQNVVYVQGDLSNASDRQRCLAAAGRVELLVNNAGVAPKVRADILEVTERDYDFVMDINLKGTFFMTQAVAASMIKAGNGGCIVNISSISAYTSSASRAQYCISKAGISMVTKLFADKLAEYEIGVYEVRPGVIKTDMTKTVAEKYDRLIFEQGIIPIKRWGDPRDVANVVSALADGVFAYCTGEVINVDGGFHLRRL